MNTTVSGSLKKGFVGLAPLCVALMGVFFMPVAWGDEIDKPCQYDDTTQSIKCGDSNTASGERSSALGVANTASGKYSSALGVANTASGDSSSALGYYNTASGKYSSALGVANTASGNYSSAMGFINTASGEQSAAFGFNNQALSNDSLAIGSYNNYSEDDVVEMGTGALAVGFVNNYESSGKEVKVGQNSAAVGRLNFTSGDNSVAFGNQNQALSDSSIALGLMNNQSASADTMGTNSVAVGYSNNTIAGEKVTVGPYSAAVGISNIASGNRSSAFGHHNTTSGEMSSAFGYINTASGEGSSAFGYRNTASNYASSAFGRYNTASGYNSSAFGFNNETLNHHSSAFGAHNTVKVDFGTAIGFGSLANRDKEMKGLYIPTNFDELDAKGKAAWQSTSAALAVGNPDNTELKYYDLDAKSMITIDTPITRQITGVAAGSEDTDAVNVAQLKEVAGMVSSGGSFSPITVSDGSSGSFTVGSAGSLKMVGSNANLSTNANGNTVTFALNNDLTLTSVSTGGVRLSANGLNNGGKQIKNVANGSANTDAANVGQMNTAINNAQKATFKAVKGGDNITATPTDKDVTLDLNKDITLTSVTADKVSVGSLTINKDGKISGVAAGAAEKDAVNFGQLNALQKTVDNLQDTVNNLPTASGSGNATPLTVAAGDDNVQVAMNANKTRATVSLKDEISLNKITTGSASLSANGLDNGGNVISNVKAGSADLEAVNVKQLKDANAANLKASVQAVKGDNKNITTQAGDKEVQVALNNDISLNSVTAADKITVGAVVVNKDGKITGVVSDINDDSTAVNVGLLKEELKKGGNYRPITVAGDTGSFEVDNGGQANWVGDGQNITTAANGDTVKIELNKNIEVDSVTAGSTVVNNDGVKVGNNGVALTPNGLNNGGQVISNVAAGVRPTDAVNVSQLNNAMGSVYGRIDSVEKHANAGIAQAMATGAMMTSTQAGQGFLSLSGSTYRGEQGYAMGYSHMSDSGKWGVKFIGSGNSRGKFGGAASVGFRLY